MQACCSYCQSNSPSLAGVKKYRFTIFSGQPDHQMVYPLNFCSTLAVTRIFTRLKEMGIAVKEGHQTVILDMARLTDLARSAGQKT